MLNLLQATGMLVTNKILHLPLKKQINGSDIYGSGNETSQETLKCL